jgi:uracil-DNA glycosylase
MTATKRQGGILLTIAMMTPSSSALGLQLLRRTCYYHSYRRTLSTRRTIPRMMPEGPEVRTLVDQLQPAVGKRLTDFQFLSGRYVRGARPRGFESFAKTITPIAFSECSDAGGGNGGYNVVSTTNHDYEDGEVNHNIDIIKSLNCKGKFIYMVLDEGKNAATNDKDPDYQRSIWITLGMTGRFVNEADVNKPRASNSDREGSDPRWYFETMDVSNGQKRKIYFRDARNFGCLIFSLSADELDQKLASLGPDMLDVENTTEEVFLEVMNNSKQNRNICKFLMDQSKIAGVGNYILAEGLYRARIDPFASLSEISVDQRKALFKELREVITSSYNSQGLTRPNGGTYRSVDGSRGQFEFQLQCYGQLVSPNNNPVIKETGPHGRTIWFVPEEQLFIPRSQRDDGGSHRGDSIGKRSLSSSLAFEKKTVQKGVTRYSLLQNSEQAFGEVICNSLTDPSWNNVLQDHMTSVKFQSMLQQIESQISSGAEVYPPVKDIFSALNLCPLHVVKVVIVGQDPYHQPGQGHGLAFSVKKGVTPPPSLCNIFKEAMDDVAIDPPAHGNLEGWARQGVLLLNTILTVRRGEANSHAKMGWEDFTDLIINKINDEKKGVVFLLWGGPAAKKACCVDEVKHTVIRSSHPSPLGANKTASPFLGSRCFSRANEALQQYGKDPIDWNAL